MDEFKRNYKEASEYTPEKTKREYDSTYLEELRLKSKAAYKSHANELRSNILIYSSEHYAKVTDSFRRTLQKEYNLDTDKGPAYQLTLNHLHRIVNRYCGHTLSFAPGCAPVPYKSDDVHQVKDAKLSNSVWRDIQRKNDWSELSRDAVLDYYLGEVWTNTYFDFDIGDVIDYELVDPETLPEEERYQKDETGQLIADEEGYAIPVQIKDENRPIYSGGVTVEMLNGADVFIEEGVDKIKNSAWVGVDKPVHKETVRYMIMNDEKMSEEDKKEALSYLTKESREGVGIFDRNSGSITDNDDMIILTYFFFRPSPEFPMGRVFIKVKNKILWTLELQKSKTGKPIWPIDNKICVRFSGRPRGYSIMRPGRSPQSEINRCISKIAETQNTLGDDKLVTTGDGLTEGQKLLGIRNIKVGKGFEKPLVIPGRSGEQYFAFLEGAIKWLYQVMDEPYEDESAGQADITATLYKATKNKKKYSSHAKAIEELFCSICQKSLELAKAYLPEKAVVNMVGSNEQINVAEFKNLGEMDYQIKVEPMEDDVESTFGRYLVTRDTIQFASKNLSPKQAGKVLSQYPWVDTDSMFGDMIIDDKEAENIVLALDRGEMPPISMFDNNEEIVRQIVRRQRKPDWPFAKQKNPAIEQNYQLQYEERKNILAKQMEDLKAVNAGFIPTTGPLVPVDVYINEPTKDGGQKAVKMKMPTDSIVWTAQKIANQGQRVEGFEDLPNSTKVDIYRGNNNLGGMSNGEKANT